MVLDGVVHPVEDLATVASLNARGGERAAKYVKEARSKGEFRAFRNVDGYPAVKAAPKVSRFDF
jgi:hypothetical protein